MNFFRGRPWENPPDSLILFQLIRAFPGYTREQIEAEDPQLIDDWLMFLNAEAAASRDKGGKG